MSEGQTPSVGRAVAAATIAAALAALIPACLRGHVRVCSPRVGLYFWNLRDALTPEALRDDGEKETEAERMRGGGGKEQSSSRRVEIRKPTNRKAVSASASLVPNQLILLMG